MKEKWVGIVTIKYINYGIIVEAVNGKEARFLIQALIAREYPSLEIIPTPFVAVLKYDEAGILNMNPSER